MKKTRFVTTAAIVAALYVVLSYLSHIMGLATGAVQIRFSEMLTVLPFFSAAAIPGLAVGCLISNVLMGCAVWDIVFGTLATLLGALGTYFLRRQSPYLAAIPPIAANTLIVPFVISAAYGGAALPLLFAGVFMGELVSCGVFGTVLLKVLSKRSKDIF